MKKNYILFFDSGIGGLSTLGKCMQNFNANYIYFADNLHAPYGKLSINQIYKNIKNIVEILLQKYNITTIVLACNTATTSAIKLLRNYFKKINFIGTEPAVMLAKNLNYKKIMCIATPVTVKQQKYTDLCDYVKILVKNVPLADFATNIEQFLLNNSIKDYLEISKTIYKLKAKLHKFDCLVLGCTHYVLIKDYLEKYIKIPIIDGNYGVCKRLINLEQNQSKSTLKILLSNEKAELKQKYIKILNQTLAKA